MLTKNIKKTIPYILICGLFITIIINPSLTQANTNSVNNPEQIFSLSYASDNDYLILNWKIEKSNYLYQDQLQIKTDDNTNLINYLQLPDPIIIDDNIIGPYKVYTDSLTLKIPKNLIDKYTKLDINFQGCSADGFCYFPIKKTINLNPTLNAISDFNYIQNIISSAPFFVTLLLFYGLGLLLSLTPCVLPMIPIGLYIIVGSHKIEDTQSKNALSLTSVYVFSMSIIYAIAGIIAAKIGVAIQNYLQNPTFIIPVIVILIILALNQFGVFSLFFIHKFNHILTSLEQRLRKGTILTAIFMGAISALIISPCVTPVLVGALTYINQQGDLILGGSALFLLGMGLGTPFILLAIVGPKILPKTAVWMKYIKYVTGLLLLFFALWLSQRIIPIQFTDLTDPNIVSSYKELENKLDTAKNNKQKIILDFYANWCISCVKLEKEIFSNHKFKDFIKDNNLAFIIIDLSKMNEEHIRILKKYKIFAPPAILFFDENGNEQSEFRVIGEISYDDFMKIIN